MKKILIAVGMSLFLSSCAIVQSPVSGFIYTDLKAPFAVTDNSQSSKVGTAEVKSILGIVAQGDASIEKAAKSAGITKIHHVDYHAHNIIGIVATFKVMVYGE